MLRLTERQRSLLRIGAIGTGLGLLCATTTSAAVFADTGTLKYTCSASILTDQPITALVHGTAPETATVGDTVTLTGFSADVAVNESATGALYVWLGARSVTGSASLETSVDNAGTSVPQPNAELAISDTPVPASGELVVSAAGADLSFVTTTAGTVRFQVGNFTGTFIATNTTGETSNIPVTCVLDAGQDPTIATVTVTDPVPPTDPEPSADPSTPPTDPEPSVEPSTPPSDPEPSVEPTTPTDPEPSVEPTTPTDPEPSTDPTDPPADDA